MLNSHDIEDMRPDEPEKADGCTEENCRRCRTPRELRTPDMYHAGIGSYPSQPQEQC